MLEALAIYQKRGADLTDVDAITDMLKSESDRGAVIIMVSFVEDELLERILARFTVTSRTQRKNLIRSGAPLNSLGARMTIAQAMGIIGDDDVFVLEILKGMRNACAHSRHQINFDTPELRDALIMCLGGGDADDILDMVDGTMIRDLFIFVAGAMLNTLAGDQERGAARHKMSLEIVMRLRTASGTLHGKQKLPPRRRRPPLHKG